MRFWEEILDKLPRTVCKGQRKDPRNLFLGNLMVNDIRRIKW